MGNSIILLREDGSRQNIESIDGLMVEFRGRGSAVEVGEGSVFRNSKFIIGNDSNILVAKTHARGIINTTADLSGIGRNKVLMIGAGCSIESCRFAMANESNIKIILGKNCMLSSNITFRGTDGHTIYDLESRKVLNQTRPILIGDNVWIGSGATFVKGSSVAANTVVATMSLVSRSFTKENTVIAGNPAEIVKSNVGWDRSYIEKF